MRLIAFNAVRRFSVSQSIAPSLTTVSVSYGPVRVDAGWIKVFGHRSHLHSIDRTRANVDVTGTPKGGQGREIIL